MRQKKTLLTIAALISAFLISVSLPLKSTKLQFNGETGETEVLKDSIVIESISPKDSLKDKLIIEVENYIYNNFPKVKKEIPTLIVEHGLEHEIDILFMMAQTQIETQYGTTGAGREASRRSLFGVATKRYQTYKNAFEDYVRVLKKFYLTKGKTEEHLMRKYTTSGGLRYAGDPNYEKELRNAYNVIKKKTNIEILQKEYRLINA